MSFIFADYSFLGCDFMKIAKMSKSLVALLLSVTLIMSCLAFSPASAEVTVEQTAAPSFAQDDCLYAHAAEGSQSTEAWHKWEKFDGMNAKTGVYYLFLSSGASDSEVEIYNSYSQAVTVSDTQIEPKTSAVVPYTSGEETDVTVADESFKLIIYKSDAEASVYVNDTTNSYVDSQGNTVNTDLWSFLTADKENAVSGSACAIADKNGITDTTLKKIKGRGNMTWREDKKGFNVTFNDKVTIGSITSKKFSMVTNSKEATLLRNQIMYDLANDTGSPYAPQLSFVDFYVNGAYIGSYSFSPKVDMGKSSLVALKDTSDVDETNFNFLVELDVWNYEGDTNFKTNKGFHVALKTPDLDGYDSSDALQLSQYNFIKNKFQQLEDAIYGSSLSDLEAICDLDSLAVMYLVNEFGKNCDGGYTSTYFAYNKDEDKFYATPVWDFDSTLGNVDCLRDDCSKSTCYYSDWVTRTATYNSIVNPLGQPFNLSGTDSQGKTFEDICKSIWGERFIPAIKVLIGEQESNGRLKSVDDYFAANENGIFINYIHWNFKWNAAQYTSGIDKTYTTDYKGEYEYLKDWINARANWMSQQYGFEAFAPQVPVTPPLVKPDADTFTIYFENTADWENVKFFVWSGKSVLAKWPGKKATYVGTSENGKEIYSATFDGKYDNIIFNNGDKEQTCDIALSQYNLYSVKPDSYTEEKGGKLVYNVTSGVYTQEGDVDKDGRVSVKDATLIQKYIASIVDLDDTQKSVADVNHDGKINIKDATVIQMYCAGIITSFS